jgi:6-methylsalicylate decarboxylase
MSVRLGIVTAVKRIDVHHHVATRYNPIYDVAPDHEWWTVDNALRVMDDNAIEFAVLSGNPPLPQSQRALKAMMAIRDGWPGKTAPIRAAMRRGARSSNEATATLASSHPDRFGWYATVALPDGDDAAHEAVYALDELGADAIFMPTNIGPLYLGDPRLDALLAELDARSATVLVHPLYLPCPVVTGIPGHVVDFLLSTARAATNLVYRGAMRRFANIRFILTHAGGFIPYALQRISLELAHLDPRRTVDEIEADFKRFYYDLALATAPSTVATLLANVPASQVVYGSDYPFNQPDGIAFFTNQLDAIDTDDTTRQLIARRNAERLFPRLGR